MELRGAAGHGEHLGLAAQEWGLQCVVRGVHRRFAFWVLQREVGVGEAAGLRTETDHIKAHKHMKKTHRALRLCNINKR